MDRVHVSNLSVTIIPPATSYGPVDSRKYTLTKNTANSECYLAVGYKYDMNFLNEVAQNTLTAEWKRHLGEYILDGKIYLNDTDLNEIGAQAKLTSVLEQLPKSIRLLIEGDRTLFSHVPWLKDAPIYIEIASASKKIKTVQYCGTPRNYLIHTQETQA